VPAIAENEQSLYLPGSGKSYFPLLSHKR